MPDIITSRVNELSKNEPNNFIFADHRRCTFVDTNITGVDPDSDDSNNK